MAKKELDTLLKPLDRCAIQPYFSNSVQLADIIEWVLDQTGQADMAISTFSTSEEFLRRLARMKGKGLLRSCSLCCDLRATRKTAGLYHFIKGVFDSISLGQNHSKAVLISNRSYHVSVITSQNQTRGDRFEAGVITTDTDTFFNLRLGFYRLAENSMPLDAIFRSND